MNESSAPKNPADWLFDLCLYAPIGFALDAHRYVPEFVERGRSQVAVARTLGKFAVDRLEQQFPPLAAVLNTLGLNGEQSPAAKATRPRVAAEDVAVEPAPRSAVTPPVSDDGAPEEDALAIPGYASLAASQVVPRLARLDVHDLAAIRRFETAHRARRTVLNRVDQLLSRSV